MRTFCRAIVSGSLALLIFGGCAGAMPGRLAGVSPSTLSPARRAVVRQAWPVKVDAAVEGATVSSDVYGASLATWFNFTQPFVNPSLASTGIRLVRYPGGSESDAYHWERGGSLCGTQGYLTPKSSFDDLVAKVVKPLRLDLAITLNYGSNRTCDGGGDPAEAAAWVARAKTIGAPVRLWTVGNENYGSWEYDLHARKHDPTTYADAFRNGYWPAVKAADASAPLGVVVTIPGDGRWNDVVLREAAPFDFVELHYYPEYVRDSDGLLLGRAIDRFVAYLRGLRMEMTADGVPSSVPIYMGEFNADAGTEGKQSVSIVNGLFFGQMLGSLQSAGVPDATWWIAYGSCDVRGGDYSKSLYGWQHFGSEALFSDGLPDPTQGCASAPAIAGGTPFPTARVLALYDSAVPAGSKMLKLTVPTSLGSSVRAYAYARRNGYAIVFFNNTLQPVDVVARIENAKRSSYAATLTVYGKAEYDASRKNTWSGPATQSLGTVSTSGVPLTLAPYSASALTLK
jgi:hypothetical protein